MFHSYKNIFMAAIKLQGLDAGAASDAIRQSEISPEALDASAQARLEEAKAKLQSMDKTATVEELEDAILEVTNETNESIGKALLDQVVENYFTNNPGIEWEFETHFGAVDLDTASFIDTRAFGTASVNILEKHGITQEDLIAALNDRLQAKHDTIASEDIAMNAGPVEMNADLQAREDTIAEQNNMEQWYIDVAENMREIELNRIADNNLKNIAEQSAMKKRTEADTKIPVMEEIAIAEAQKEQEAIKVALTDTVEASEQGYIEADRVTARNQAQEVISNIDIANLPKDMSEIQTALNKILPEGEKIVADGIIWPKTRKALQIAANTIMNTEEKLVVDGKIWSKTKKAFASLKILPDYGNTGSRVARNTQHKDDTLSS